MRLSRRYVIVVLSLCVLGLGGVAAALAGTAAAHETPGEWLAQEQGHIVLHHYDTLGQTTQRPVPSWLPPDTTQVTVKQPGPRDATEAGGLKLDGVVPAGWHPPSACRRTAFAMPFDGGGYWPLTAGTRLLRCPDGALTWLLFMQGDHAYLWPLPAGG
ncbi:MAG TPA: hypothetical protein VJT31_22550 [Rugosimonospora sp.]|nr:hypothetical protein [Rugosimonospora sp.]